mgnify:FL=1
MPYDLTKDDKFDLKLSQSADQIINNPNLSQCYRSRDWPDNYKCIMPLINKQQQCEKVYQQLSKTIGKRSWYNCFQEEDKVVLSVFSFDN